MKNKILSLFEEHNFLFKEDICKLLNETDIDAYLEELCNDYILYKNKANKYGLLASFNYYVGNIRLHKKGYGFFKCDQFDEDIFIKAIDLDNALDNDTVMVWVAPGNKNEKKDAYVVKVLHHNNDLICKVVKKFFHSSNKMIVCDTYPDVRIKVDDYKDASFDDIIILKVLDVDLVNKNTIYGEIKEIIGNKNDNGIDIKACVYKYGLDLDFSDEVKEDINRINNKYLNDKAKEYKKRRRVDRDIITIDGADAKDLDDAISVKRNEDGTYFLGVYIADVSYFVEEDSEVDKEALKRGTSVYLVNKVIPMLPKKLSNDLCSLNENEDKYVIAVEMTIDKYGHVIENDVFEAIIKTKHRMTYDNVNILIDYIKSSDKNDFSKIDVVNEYNDILDMVQDMSDLHYLLTRMYKQRGKLDIDVPTSKIIVDEDGVVENIVLEKRYDAEELIENFMVLTNETVANMITSLDLPFIYRVHDEPSDIKLDKLAKVLRANIKKDNKNKTKKFQAYVNNIRNNNPFINTYLLRTMAKAKYSRINIGHFGLASKCYTHFTSPIRRYPDLLVHRLIRKYIFNSEIFYNTYNEEESIILNNKIDNIAEISSECEINANNLEYEVEDMKKAEYMEKHIGDEYDAVITSMTNFGFFVSLDNAVEGLVHVKELKDDKYYFNDELMCMVGKNKNKMYKLGDKLKVMCIYANKEEREIDFKVLKKIN